MILGVASSFSPLSHDLDLVIIKIYQMLQLQSFQQLFPISMFPSSAEAKQNQVLRKLNCIVPVKYD